MILLIFPLLVGCSSSNNEVSVVFKKGESVSEFVEKLKEEGVISRPFILKVLLKFAGMDRYIKPGKYVFKVNGGEFHAFTVIKRGPEKSFFKLTIKEGESIKDIADRLDSLELDKVRFISLSKDTLFIEYLSKDFPFLKGKRSLEGFLYPNTYYIDYGSKEEDVFIQPLKLFKKVWDSLRVEDRAEDVGLKPYEVLILASIVEKEAVIEEEKPIIASVFINRLKRNMPLAADPTIKYILDSPPKILPLSLTKVSSPYNTYINPGLPPTPICSPTASSIEAVLNPAKTDYLYFASKDGLRHRFARTYKEHLINVKKMKLE